MTLSGLGLKPIKLFYLLARHQGYASIQEIGEDIEERFSRQEAQHFTEEVRRAERAHVGYAVGVDELAEPALLALPEALFLDAIELGFQQHGGYGGGFPSEVPEINGLFERRGIFFRFDRWGRAEWVGDPGAWETITEPALKALQDSRLAGARNEFESARKHLREGSSKHLEDAIEEAGKAVESAMKVVLDERGVKRKGTEAAFKLFELLRDGNVVEGEADQAVLGTARIRNQWGGHGAGQAPRNPPYDLSELAVQGAAAAIVFLASHLP